MRTKLLTLLGILLLLPTVSIFAQDNQQIIIQQNDLLSGSETSGPRMPVIVPISCYVNEAVGFISFSFSYDFGEVDINIENLDTAAIISVVADTADGGIVIPFSPAPGFYHISIVTASGTEYIGDFEI